MNIALVHDWLVGMRGGEKCLEVLCRRFPTARLFTLVHTAGATSAPIERMRITTSFLQRMPAVRRYYRYLLPLMPLAMRSLVIPRDVDMVVSFSHAVAKSVRPPRGVPHVCYCFTPMRYAWQGRDDYFGPREGDSPIFVGTKIGTVPTKIGTVPKPAAVARNFVLDRLRHWDRATADRVTHFVAISRTVAKRIAENYGRTSRVIYPPVDTEFYTPDNSPREDFYLAVSALVPYKRIDLAVEACNRLGRRLVVIGEGPERGRLQRLAGPTVALAGRLSDHAIRDHMRRARALLFPGNEDFGIVPVEAQACGCPVVAFGQGGATETVIPADWRERGLGIGDWRLDESLKPSSANPQSPIPNPPLHGTGLWFDRQTPESLAEAMLRLEAQPAWFSSSLARRLAERFAEARFERELLGYLDEVCGV